MPRPSCCAILLLCRSTCSKQLLELEWRHENKMGSKNSRLALEELLLADGITYNGSEYYLLKRRGWMKSKRSNTFDSFVNVKVVGSHQMWRGGGRFRLFRRRCTLVSFSTHKLETTVSSTLVWCDNLISDDDAAYVSNGVILPYCIVFYIVRSHSHSIIKDGNSDIVI